MTISQPDPELQAQQDIMERYRGCMEEIKRRTRVIRGFWESELHTPYLITTVESVCLQIRKILELIALASLVANKPEYEKQRKAFRNDWHAKRILKTLDRVNPDFYPCPTSQVIDPETNRVVEVESVPSGYLSRAEFEELYDKCGGILHAHNPFSESQQEIQEFWDGVQEWVNKIIVLLNHHQVQLVDERYQLWVLMQAKDDGDVHVWLFEREDNPGATEEEMPTPKGEQGPAVQKEGDALALDDDNGRITYPEARRHGIAPVHRGHPAYAFMRDGDGDGVVCE